MAADDKISATPGQKPQPQSPDPASCSAEFSNEGCKEPPEEFPESETPEED